MEVKYSNRREGHVKHVRVCRPHLLTLVRGAAYLEVASNAPQAS